MRGLAGTAVNGIAGMAALFAAFALRIRRLRVFGFRTISSSWLIIGAAVGLFAFGASFIVEYVYFLFITEPNTQADFQVVAKSGPLMLSILVLTGAILTPLGEEFVFRGVIANAFNRYGAWVSVIGSALIFAAMHGPSVIFFDALLVGLLTGVLFRKTGSIWPPAITHIVYNGLHLFHYSIT
ncbi:CPBP family intramembrane glutamic endopeptidase [Croceibacterium xixiisoli]|uniref:CPBP family intramembrane glutamic endopeptidase n=1 Tax=Croceibacterium xixiisoli TaxID=1476466 RepID=UPI00192596D7|nr:CPBP family intramembrane glutamic endopeptidase [Croceibacterium xixiisoli]